MVEEEKDRDYALHMAMRAADLAMVKAQDSHDIDDLLCTSHTYLEIARLMMYDDVRKLEVADSEYIGEFDE